jgi:hypothetical protein
MVDQVSAVRIKADAQQASKKLEMGWMGIIFGDVANKPGNIAAVAIVLAFVMFAAVLIFVPDTAASPKREALTLFGSIITGALGFLFGRAT